MIARPSEDAPTRKPALPWREAGAGAGGGAKSGCIAVGNDTLAFRGQLRGDGNPLPFLL
ncbi:hypothetical protein [Maritimibacter sp. HL-12]|uniref:hypothetical protein n=1 Tax=Maritimibacter sp. HL-12 TaxID=1162418 RepID=UPI0015939487|nr:hypothetical protein [Maritimibacter sp. HL-12]